MARPKATTVISARFMVFPWIFCQPLVGSSKRSKKRATARHAVRKAAPLQAVAILNNREVG